MTNDELYNLLEEKYNTYNHISYFEDDPISVPHQFENKEDIEIAAFLSSTLAFGRRELITKSANTLIHLMDNVPSEFIRNFKEKDLLRFRHFKYRTFKSEDIIYFIRSLHYIYLYQGGLQNAFNFKPEDNYPVRSAIINFRKIFITSDHFLRTEKHIANPEKNSTCKRLNLFLRWMVRKDNRGVDFGIWEHIKTEDLLFPIDIHCGRVARKLGLLKRKQNDWKAVIELTEKLKEFDANDPVKYDYALFNLGINENY